MVCHGEESYRSRVSVVGSLLTTIFLSPDRIFNEITTRLPSKEHLRWQQTMKLLAYRESTHTILTCPYHKSNPLLRYTRLFCSWTTMACTQLRLCLGWKGQWICCVTIIKEGGREGRDGGEGREGREGGEGGREG